MPIVVTDQNFEAEVKNRKGLILVDFWAEWCGPCQILGPIIAQVAEQVKGKAEVGKLNVDEHPEIAGGFNVMGIPTVILFKDGQPVEQFVGLRRKEDYLNMIEKYSQSS